MENQETFTMIDENGKEQIARILNIVEINHQEYLIYMIFDICENLDPRKKKIQKKVKICIKTKQNFLHKFRN